MHGGTTETILGLLKIPVLWALSLLTFLVGAALAFFQNNSTPVLLGVLSIIGGILTGVIFRFIDQWYKRKDEKKDDDKSDEAKLALESANLRQEERDFFNSVITRLQEEKTIASRRGHALGGEVDRLRNNLLTCISLLNGKVPEGVIIFNAELHRYLAELEELPLPALAPKPRSLQDIHRSSSPDLPRMQ